MISVRYGRLQPGLMIPVINTHTLSGQRLKIGRLLLNPGIALHNRADSHLAPCSNAQASQSGPDGDTECDARCLIKAATQRDSISRSNRCISNCGINQVNKGNSAVPLLMT